MTVTVEQLVSREVHHCVSALISTLAKGYGGLNEELGDIAGQAAELTFGVDDWEEAATQEGWISHGAGLVRHKEYGIYDMTTGRWEDLCAKFEIEPYQWEVYEHWIVSEWLADELIKHGERVDKDFAGLCIWGRTTTGQAISQDAVIQKIHAELTGLDYGPRSQDLRRVPALAELRPGVGTGSDRGHRDRDPRPVQGIPGELPGVPAQDHRSAPCQDQGARMKGSRKITKTEWQAKGGLKNPRLWRKQDKAGRWYYYEAAP